MKHEKLRIIKSENADFSAEKDKGTSNPKNRRAEAEAKYERRWLLEPDQFDPSRTSIGRERIERTFQLITSFTNVEGKKVLDVGTGKGELARRLEQSGASVHVSDISKNALQHLESTKEIKTFHDALPHTRLDDNAYDIVVCADVIAEMHPDDYRLAISEISRLLNKEGICFCSTPLDFRTEGPLTQFINLIESEFNIEKSVLSYHSLSIRILDFVKTPSRFYRCWKEPHFRKEELKKKSWLLKTWWQLNSLAPLAIFWKGIDILLYPCIYLLEQNRAVLIGLENICRFFWPESGVSHVIVAGKKRPLFIPPSRMDARPLRKYPKWE